MADDELDFDIYGDDGTPQDQQPFTTANNHTEDNLFDNDDAQYDRNGTTGGSTSQSYDSSTPTGDKPPADTTAQSTQGTKRKASDEEDFISHTQDQDLPTFEPAEPGALPALKLSELHWWTTEEDLRAFCAAAHAESALRDLSFGEHKINGKSRGEAYMEFSSAAAAGAVKRAIERYDGEGEAAKRKNPFQVYYSPMGNPFKGRDSGAAGKKDPGAYNANPNHARGGFRGRGPANFGTGRGGFVPRGGGYQQQQQSAPNQQAWGSNGASGGFGGMQRGGGMMQGAPMMGRGGFGMPMMGMGMGMPGMMGMGGRGGFGGMGGFGGGMMGNMGMMGGNMGMMGQQQQGQGGGQQGGNKRMKEG